MALPDAWMHELMTRNDIVSVISEYTHLSSKGGRLWGLCPFHPERDPSFSVSPDKQLFHCFSCKAGGSVIQFIKKAGNPVLKEHCLQAAVIQSICPLPSWCMTISAAVLSM